MPRYGQILILKNKLEEELDNFHDPWISVEGRLPEKIKGKLPKVKKGE